MSSQHFFIGGEGFGNLSVAICNSTYSQVTLLKDVCGSEAFTWNHLQRLCTIISLYLSPAADRTNLWQQLDKENAALCVFLQFERHRVRATVDLLSPARVFVPAHVCVRV